MKTIHLWLQDFEDQQIEEICEKYDISSGYLISMILEAINDGRINLNDII